MSAARARRWLPALLLLQAAIGLLFAWRTPAWETPDEPWHLGYVTWLKTERRLPPLSEEVLETWVHQEASQPPLYYLLAAAASWPFDTGDMDRAYVENPGRWGGVGLEARNHNYALHGPWDAPLVTPLTRGLFAARLVALAMALLAAWATFQLAAALRPERGDLALAAAGILAFTPQMAFLSGAVSNDTTAAALCTVVLWRGVALMRVPSERNATWLGLALGLALLSKSSALLLVPLVGLATLSTVLDGPGGWRGAMRHATLAPGIAALVGGGWYLRNLWAFDTLYGRELHLAMPWAREVPASLPEVVADDELWVLFVSYWAAFGWGTIRWPDGLYRVLLIVCAAGGLGLALGAARRWREGGARAGERGAADAKGSRVDGAARTDLWDLLRSPRVRGVLLLVLFSLLVFTALLSWMLAVRAHWGRLLYPTAGALSVLLAFGLHELWPRARLPLVLAAALALWAAWAPWGAIGPALRPPPKLSATEVKAIPDRLVWRIGDVAELVAATPERMHTTVDGSWRLRLCWRALRRTERELQALVHLVGADDQLVASYHSVPADGNLSTRAWEPGTAFCETVDVLIEGDVPAPAVYDVAVGLFDPENLRRLPATTRTGTDAGSGFVTRVKVEPSQPDWARTSTATFATDTARIDALAPAPTLDLDPIARDGPDVFWPTAYAEEDRVAHRIRLTGFALPQQPLCVGERVAIELRWLTGTEPPPFDLTVFLHLQPWQGPHGAPLAQADGPVRGPDGREYPSSLWSPGERIADTREIELPSSLAPGRYALTTGLYSGARAAVTDAPEGSAPDEIRLPTALEIVACEAP